MKPPLTFRRVPMPLTALYQFALMPADEGTYRVLNEVMKTGDEVQLQPVAKDRSTPQMRLFWQILEHVAKASHWESPERLLVALKIRLGRYDLMKLPNGKAVPVPHSISFAKMDHEDFQKFMDDAMEVICSEVLGGYDPERLKMEAQGYAPA